MSSALLQSELFALLTAGETVVVPHAYTARILRARFGDHLLRNAPEADNPGSLVAWNEWVSSLWSSLILEGHEDRIILNQLQEHQIWADLIAVHPGSRNLGLESPDSLADLARPALRLAASFNIADRLRRAADTPDTRIFASWLDAFRDQCHRQQILPAALLEPALTQHLRNRTLRVPGKIHLVGFDEQTPSQRDLVTALHASGAELSSYTLRHSGSGTLPLAIRAADPQEELRLAVRLIASKAARAKETTFAIILAGQTESRASLERLFRELLAPELEPVAADLSSTPWHFASQPALHTSAAIAHALDLLRWLGEPLPAHRIGTLLLSPYLSFAEPLEARARFEARTLHSHRLLRPEFSLPAFLDYASQSDRPQAAFPELRTLGRQIERDKLLQGSRPHAEWADRIRHLLRTVGWPGSRDLTPSEFAVTEAWESLLDLLSTLGATSRRVSFATFLLQLEREAGTATLPTLNPGAPVQVLSLSQAEGLTFDTTLLLSATDASLPASERPHPLLPRHLQSTLDMPGADPAKTYARARVRLQNLASRSGTLHLFAPEANESGSLRLTPLAHELGAILLPAEQILPGEPIIEPTPLDDFAEAEPLPPLPSNHIQGGARVLELQAACGFRAYAAFRLRAVELSSLNAGLEPREAGSRLHKALEILWTDLRDQVTLRQLSPAGRERKVRAAVRAALHPLHPTPALQTPWTSAFLRVLEERYTRLLDRWLNCELERSPFTILATEQERTVNIGPLELSIRVDRLDQTERGKVFVDYKTAYTLKAAQWQGPRPDAPQLPLYALLADPEELRGIAFGRVRWDEMIGWVSLTDQPEIFSKTSRKAADDLSAQREQWQAELTSLAEDFAYGHARVDPKEYPETCKYCGYRLLCRLDPSNLVDGSASDDLPEDDING